MTDLPPYQFPKYQLAPPLVPEEFQRRAGSLAEPSRWDRTRRFGIPVAALISLLILVASDLQPNLSNFWRQHQVITSAVTGVALTLIAVLVLERVLATRDRKRWRSVGLMVAGKFDVIGVEELLAILVFESRQRLGFEGNSEEIANYPDLLPEALEDPQTWARERESPTFTERLDGAVEILEETLEIWAPVLIAAPGLAAIADAATDLLITIRSVNSEFRFGEPKSKKGHEGLWAPDTERTLRLLAALRAHRYACMRMSRLLRAYGVEA